MSTKSSITYVTDPSFTTVNGGVTNLRPSKTIALERSRTGVSLPKYSQLISDGVSATTPFTAYEYSCVIHPGKQGYVYRLTAGGPFNLKGVDTTCGIYHSEYMSDHFSYKRQLNTFPASIQNVAVAQAVSKVYNKIRERQAPFSAQIFTGELKETLMLLRHPTAQLARAVETYGKALEKTRKLSGLKDRAKSSADLWLQFKFGVLPVISDAQTIIRVFDDLAAKGASELFKTKGTYSGNTTNQQVSQADSGFLVHTSEKIITYESNCYIHGGWLAVTKERLTGLDVILADLKNISELPVTAWELIPYSFLIDYFVNIGDIIEAGVTSTTSLRYISQSVVNTTRTRFTTVKSVVGNSYSTDVKLSGTLQPKIVECKLREVSRTSGLMAIPPITFTIPGARQADRYVNMAALLTKFL